MRPGSPADRAGIAAGDLITAFDGVRTMAKGDINPTGASRFASIAVRRPGSANDEAHPIAMDGFKPAAPADLLGAGLILLVAAAVILLFMAPMAGIITWVERRVSARMQSRIGPNRAGPQGFFVWIADGIKSIMKEDIVPTDSDQPLFRLAPLLGVHGGERDVLS